MFHLNIEYKYCILLNLSYHVTEEEFKAKHPCKVPYSRKCSRLTYPIYKSLRIHYFYEA